MQRISEILKNEKIENFCILNVEKAEIINSRLFPKSAKSVIAFLVPYRTDRNKSESMAHFATIRDYHGFSTELFERVIPRLKNIFPKNNFWGFADHSPINERKIAFVGGLGEIGKNGLLINERYGSYVFIGELLTDAPLEEFVPETKKNLCIKCDKCLSACPKNDICISAISQKKKKTDEDFSILKELKIVWGCDKCGEVCPINENAELSPFEYFYKDKISSPEEILKMDDKTFKSFAFSYRGKSVIEANIINVFGDKIKKDID